MLESVIERRLTALVRKAGGVCVKVMPVVAGTPDRYVLLPPGLIYLIETKAPGGRLRPAQRVWHERAAAVGVKVFVLSSTAEVEEWVRTHGKGDADL